MYKTWIVALATLLAPMAVARAQTEGASSQSQSSSSTSVDVNMNVNAGAPAAPQPVASAVAESTTNVVVGSGNAGVTIEREPREGEHDTIFLHGFRLGYLYTSGIDRPVSRESTQSYADRYEVRSPHSFLIGYELAWRLIGHDWLNVLLIGNVMVAGLEQSRLLPSANMLLGFELAESVQLGVGASITPTRDDPAHMIIAAGWTPRVGSFYVPVHFFLVPDIEGHHKFGITVGVNFGS